MYYIIQLSENEFAVADQRTDEIIAIFTEHIDAIDYVNWKYPKSIEI